MSQTLSGRFRGGRLNPIMAVAIRESESMMLSQSVTYELDPIAGRMITPITAELISVMVPLQAIDALQDPAGAYAGITEVLRDKLLSGTPLHGLENESEISKRLGVVPRMVAGVPKVCQVTRLAHNAAVNFLRQRKFVDAVLLLAANTGVTPALISQTILQRLNGVLDPEDRVNGMVSLSIPNMSLPVTGVTKIGSTAVYGPGSASVSTSASNIAIVSGSNAAGVNIARNPTTLEPAIFAQLNGAMAGGVSLVDFYNAELMDNLTREMRLIVDQNPEYGQEQIQRWAHGLSVDFGKTPFVLHESTTIFGQSIARATDSAGTNSDVMRSDLATQIGFTVPVPASELGGVIITFACLKPDETIASQPHPFLSEPWGAINFVEDELSRDPVAVTMRELNASVASADEGTIAFYTGKNELKRAYVNYGFNRQIDLATVAAKTAIWQLEVPLSVTPSSVLYPTTLSHYPFADQAAEVCTYTVSSVQTVNTPIIFGPTPVEELAIIETADIFNEVP
jgi:hypothetical protein